MIRWIKKLWPTNLHGIHPPWKAGQYVTYYLEREDGSWTAFAIRLESRTDMGAWILRTDFKTARGECTVWFHSNPSAREEDVDPVPIREELARGSAASTPDELPDDPQMQSSLAMNLLLVRRAPAAVAALREPPRAAQYPCGIEWVHRWITPGPGYEKHHDLSPRVLVTGVACLSINDGQNPTVATSFGLQDPTVDTPTSYDDFVDFSHCKAVTHQSFSLSYPATWFLRLQGTRDDRDTHVQDYFAHVGGVTCSASLSLSLRRGPSDQLTEVRQEVLARLRTPLEGPMGTLVPHSNPDFSSQVDASPYSFRLENPSIDGVAYGAVVSHPSGNMFAQVDTFGCVAKANPRREAILREFAQLLPHIVSSFRFLPHEDQGIAS